DEWLEHEGVPGIQGIDTRAVTQKLRSNGTMLGLLEVSRSIPDETRLKEDLAAGLVDPNNTDLVGRVTSKEPIDYGAGQGSDTSPVVVLVDCGTKYGILRSLLERNVRVIQVPYDYSTDKILDYEPKGIVISNGPGDPGKCLDTMKSAKGLLETNQPIMGICLGTQIMALAAGAETYKLKFGHRAVNHPCLDLKTGRCYVTTQNHGYTIRGESLGDTVFEVSHVNANDKTVEGIQHSDRKGIFGVQWHPESGPGPYDTRFLFDDFVHLVGSK
ncbi:MAG TPA: carbamoyl phosphate synthase small subunit, partial [Candidatus Binatus sp.]|nr:carbamoyl phosphate synthase small subunit [Candidatus Binatus sp.]